MSGERVLDYYNGGAGSFGTTGGPNLGVAFSSNALAIRRANAAGSGNFAGEPSPVTALSFTSGTAATLNRAGGFTTGFSFFYTAINSPGSIRVFDGLSGTGTLLAMLELPTTPSTPGVGACASYPAAMFCPFVAIGVAFTGTARSVEFGGSINQIGFDNVTLGSATPVGAVPEPGTWVLVGTGLLGVGGVALRRQRALATPADRADTIRCLFSIRSFVVSKLTWRSSARA